MGPSLAGAVGPGLRETGGGGSPSDALSRLALKEMISTCLLSSAAPRLQIKNQLRVGRRICQAEVGGEGWGLWAARWMGVTGRDGGGGLSGPQVVERRVPETVVLNGGGDSAHFVSRCEDLNVYRS